MNPLALAGLALAVLAPSLGTSIANVGLPTLAQAFQATPQQAQWVVLAYLLALTAAAVGAGRLGDRLGRRRVLLAGTLLFAAASAACAVAPTLGALVAARAAQGVGAAAMVALTMALVGEVVPPDRTGRAMGLLGTTSALGTALGPSLGGALIVAGGWPTLFLAVAPVGLLAWALVRRHLPADRPEARLAARRADPAAALRDPRLRVALATGMAAPAAVMATMVVGPFHLEGALGLDPAWAGLVLSVGPLVAALVGVPAGRLVDRFGAPGMATAGLAGMVAGALLLALPGPAVIAAFVAPVAVLTAGYALFQAANQAAAMAGVAADQRGAVAGMLTLARNLGLIAGTAVVGALFASGMRAVFAADAALLVAALALATLGRAPARLAPSTEVGR